MDARRVRRSEKRVMRQTYCFSKLTNDDRDDDGENA